MFSIINKKIEKVEEYNQKQDSQINNLIKSNAMKGVYDKK